MDRLYRVAFLAGMSLIGAQIGLGVYESLANRRCLPPVYIDYVQDLEHWIVDERDYARAVRELRLAVRIDYFGKRPRHYFELCKAAHRIHDRENQRYALDALRSFVDAGAVPDRRIYYYLSVAIMLQPDVTPEQTGEALGCAGQAIEEEPDFGSAHSMFGQILAILAATKTGAAKLDELRRAEFHLRKALELDPTQAEASQALAELGPKFAPVPGVRQSESSP